MKIRVLAVVATLLAGTGFSRADIISNSIAADGDGVISCYTYGFLKTGDHAFQLGIDGAQHAWDYGHIQGDIITDTETDPTLTLNNEINNDTGIAWNDYHVTVTMDKSFSFSDVSVGNTGWTGSDIAPTNNGVVWIGYINYFAGDVVPDGGTLDFSYAISFTGSVSFQEALMPSTVPEPGTFALMICGLGGLLFMRRRFGLRLKPALIHVPEKLHQFQNLKS